MCTVKPKVTAQQKGEINLSSYKDYCLLKSEALKSDKVISIVPSRSGVIYQLRKTDVGAFTAPAMDIAELDDIASGFEMHLPKIPAHILMQIINFFRKVADRSGCEALAHILYDKRRNLYTVNVPKQKVSACSVRCVTDKEYPDYLIHVMDIHSHNVMPAEFSETDDNDEKATRLYAVVGTLDKAMPEISVRASCAGYYIPVSAGDVFESDFKAYPCPGDWHNQLTVEHEPKHALELKNSDLLMPQRELV